MPKEESIKVYQILTNNAEDEYYTYELPILGKDKATCTNVIKKGVISEKIMQNQLQECYKIELQDEKSKQFDLQHGFAIKLIDASTLEWLTKNEKDAKEALKDKLLAHYQSIIPTLIENVNVLKQQLTRTQQQENEDTFVPQRVVPKKNLLI